jgi:hypothetical protein
MFLFLRMVLYFVGGALAGQGIGVWDEAAGTLTIQVDNLVPVLWGIAINVGTFITSRFATQR